MSATSTAISLSSPSSVAGQQSPASKASGDYEESSLHSLPDHDWDIEGIEHIQNIEYYPSNSPPETPGLLWDSRPTSAALSAPALKSIFDDWEDTAVPIPANPPVIVEEDGAQTVLIPADSPFFNTPSPRKPFGFAPFSTDLPIEIDIPSPSNMEKAGNVTSALKMNKTASSTAAAGHPDPKFNTKNLALLLDATFLHPTFGSDTSLISPVFSTPSLWVGDDASWAPKSFMSGPDVPLDCIYTAGDISPMAENWEGSWSPVVLGPFRSAPCA